MRFSLIPLLVSTIAPIASSLPLVPRDANELLSTITKLNAAVGDLTTAVNKFDGSLLGLLPQALEVVKTEATVDFTILKATYITNQSANFTAAESSQIVGSLAGGIGPIQTSLDALKAKQPVFKKTLTAPIVLLDLKILKKHTGELIDALTGKVTADVVGILGLGRTILDGAFDSAIAVYSA